MDVKRYDLDIMPAWDEDSESYSSHAACLKESINGEIVLYNDIKYLLIDSPVEIEKLVDEDYWVNAQESDEHTDPIARVLLRFIKTLEIIIPLLSDVVLSGMDAHNQLKKERNQIVKETMNHFSDICSMIDVCANENESTYEACKRIISTLQTHRK